ncbi:MAG: uridine kinase [Bacteriovoracaceae bacterium]|jgi:uridine kinase
MDKITIIAITGGSGSGKTTFARDLLSELGDECCGLMYQDSYYIDQSSRFDRDGGAVNFDHPESLDFKLMASHLEKLKKGEDVEIPVYDFATHSRLNEVQLFKSKKIILVDGILILSQEILRPHFDRAIFIDCPEDLRFERRLNRDVVERGRTPEGVRAQFKNQVKPMHDQFVEPSRKFATRVVNQDDFQAAMEVVADTLI